MLGMVSLEIHQTFKNPGVATLGIFEVRLCTIKMIFNLRVHNDQSDHLELEINTCGTGNPLVPRPLCLTESQPRQDKYLNSSFEHGAGAQGLGYHTRHQEQFIPCRLFQSGWSVDLSEWYICRNIWKLADTGSLWYVLILHRCVFVSQ